MLLFSKKEGSKSRQARLFQVRFRILVKSKFAAVCDGANFTTCAFTVSKFWSNGKLYEYANRGCSEALPGEPEQWSTGVVNRHISPFFKGQNVKSNPNSTYDI